jgi:hypothetical protein
VSCGFGELLLLVESPEQVVQVGSGEALVEQHRGLLVAVLEGRRPMGHLAKIQEDSMGLPGRPSSSRLKRQGGASRRCPLRQAKRRGGGCVAIPGEGCRSAPSPRPGSAAVAVAGPAAPAPPSRQRRTPAPSAPRRRHTTAVGAPRSSPHRSTPMPGRGGKAGAQPLEQIGKRAR